MAKPARKHPARPSRAYTEGLKVRQRWLGKAYVDKAFRDADDFTIDLQHYVTEHGWGAPAALDSFRIARQIFAEGTS